MYLCWSVHVIQVTKLVMGSWRVNSKRNWLQTNLRKLRIFLSLFTSFCQESSMEKFFLATPLGFFETDINNISRMIKTDDKWTICIVLFGGLVSSMLSYNHNLKRTIFSLSYTISVTNVLLAVQKALYVSVTPDTSLSGRRYIGANQKPFPNRPSRRYTARCEMFVSNWGQQRIIRGFFFSVISGRTLSYSLIL